MFLPGFGIRVMLSSYNELGTVHSASTFWKSLVLDPEIKHRSLALQADSLSSELSGKC